MDDRPILFADLQWIYSAFMELNGSRRFTTAGAGPIPISEMKCWLDLYEIESAWDRQLFVHCILKMDEKFLEWQKNKTSTLTSSSSPPTKSSKPSKRH